MLTALRDNARLRQGIGNFILVFLSVGIAVLYSAYQRPIWFDELMHYACGGWTNWSEVYQRILAPLYDGSADFSYPSSVFYSAATYPILQAFGANAFSLRYLSFIGGIAILVLGLLFLRKAGATWFWRLLFLFAMMGQFFAMNYISEARPYALLGATSMALAVYYLYRSKGHVPKGILLVAWVGCVVGSLNHVYFMLYLLAFGSFFYFFKMYSDSDKISWSNLLRFVNPYILVTAILIQLLLRAPHAIQRPALQRSWLSFREDAFFYTTPEGGFLRLLADTSFQFLPIPSAVAPLILLCLIVLALFSGLAARNRVVFLRDVSQPAWFLLLLLGISAAISAASLFGGYQILNRQWIASLFMMPLGFVWLISVMGRNLRDSRSSLYWALAVVVAIPIVFTGLYRADWRWNVLENADISLQQFSQEYPQVLEENAKSFILGDIGAVTVANVNLSRGGKVWRAFRVEGREYVHSCTTG